MRRAGIFSLLVSLACAEAAAPDDAGALRDSSPPDDDGGLTLPPGSHVLFIAGGPSHGPGEHEYFAGAMILKAMIEQSGVTATVARAAWPDEASFAAADAIVMLTDGNASHPLQAGDRFAQLKRHLDRGIGFASLHWAVHVLEPYSVQMLAALGGHYSDPISVNPHWDARFDSFPDHPITRGVSFFELRDEWYYNLKFSPGVVPILRAVPPDDTRFTQDAAMYPGRAEVVSWAFTRADNGRSFGFTGMHAHRNWGEEKFRRLVTNGLLWILWREVPPGGAPVVMDPALLDQNLDRK